MIKSYKYLLISNILILTVSAQTYQLKRKNLPLLELGVGLGYANLPRYEGSKERRNISLPFPTFIYRGDVIRSDEDGGLRGRLKFSDRLEINAAFGLSLPVDSDNIEARRGMDDLDPLFELGPGFIYHAIVMTEDRPFSLSVNLATRYAFTSDLSFTKARGWVLNPIVYSRIKFNEKYSAFLSYSYKWAEKSYQSYYYDVPKNFETSIRPAYHAGGGPLASRVANFFVYQPNDQYAYALGVIYSNYQDAANKNSPLHVKDENYSLILGVTYWFYQSKDLVKVVD